MLGMGYSVERSWYIVATVLALLACEHQLGLEMWAAV